jgi:uncharacterized protein (DUF983 family)
MNNVGLGQALLTAKCPQCRKGDLYNNSLFSFRKLTHINQSCGHCGALLVPEPDFFYGAMYISYAFSVALLVAVMILLNLFYPDADTWVYVVIIFVLNVLMMPLMLRYSKVLYLYGVGKLKYKSDK